jgi:pyruvate ferredoxin oxidoreductase alpha subunit
MLPVIVNLDGFYLSFTREPVIVPDPEQVKLFLPPFRPAHLGFKASAPHALGVAVLGGTPYSYFRHQMHLAAMNALDVHREAAGRSSSCSDGGTMWSRLSASGCGGYGHDQCLASKAAAVDGPEQRAGRGLLRLRMIRPWPADAIRHALRAAGCGSLIRIYLQGRAAFSSEIAAVFIMKHSGGALFIHRGLGKNTGR